MTTQQTIDQRFGRLGTALIASLPQFNLDLINVVASYSSFLSALSIAHNHEKAWEQKAKLDHYMTLWGFGSEFVDVVCAGAAAGDDKLFVSGAHHILVFDGATGRQLAALKAEGAGAHGLALSDGGELFVTHASQHCVTVYGLTTDAAGKISSTVLRKIGQQGDGLGQFQQSGGLAICKKTRTLSVVDRGHHCVQTFTLEGKFVRAFGSKDTGSGDRERVQYPMHVAINDEGTIAVSDIIGHKVLLFDALGGFLRVFSCTDTATGKAIYFHNPTGLAFDRDGHLIIADSYGFRIFTDDGKLLCGHERALHQLHGVCVDVEGRITTVLSGLLIRRYICVGPPLQWDFDHFNLNVDNGHYAQLLPPTVKTKKSKGSSKDSSSTAQKSSAGRQKTLS